jgi:hypothetical protein
MLPVVQAGGNVSTLLPKNSVEYYPAPLGLSGLALNHNHPPKGPPLRGARLYLKLMVVCIICHVKPILMY